MARIRLKTNQRVIITQGNIHSVAMITGKSIKHKRQVYNIKTETGSEFPYVVVDEPMDSMYINSEWTRKIAPRIVTNLNALNKGNLRNPIIHEPDEY